MTRRWEACSIARVTHGKGHIRVTFRALVAPKGSEAIDTHTMFAFIKDHHTVTVFVVEAYWTEPLSQNCFRAKQVTHRFSKP